MKQYWQRMALKIDALSLRERVIIFAMAALILIVMVNTFLLDPQYVRQKQLNQKIRQEQAQTAALQVEIQQKASSHLVDPDTANKTRLQQLKQQSAQMQHALQDMQKGLVSPDKMASLLEDLLKHNGSLQLVSLKTLPVSTLTEAAAATKKAPDGKSPESAATPEKDKTVIRDQQDASRIGKGIYRHGVEIIIQGGYPELTRYLTQLEAMPWQLFWGKAKLSVDTYPKSTLVLTLFTLSLDEKWLNL
ncbi:MAG TPA: MSHA biogenesis protein MshJ [Burkholderiaceae bacterium]|nr:MSHA biogenesis protein MshJ [Burkholderiaceae bacterium]